eukprot:1343068-Rhodomonas_salina.2
MVVLWDERYGARVRSIGAYAHRTATRRNQNPKCRIQVRFVGGMQGFVFDFARTCELLPFADHRLHLRCGSGIRQVSTAHRIAAYASSVPHIA